MRNEDNDCIRYLMKEMDPSEELLMERAMMEDEDLLIEVESMRQTLQKLDKLPKVDPPTDVTEAVMEKAAQQAEKNRKNNQTFRAPAFKMAVAATLALTITAGGAWFYVGAEKDPVQPQAVTSPESSAPTQVTESSAGVQFTNTNNGNGIDNIESISTSAQQTRNIDPWIDRNDIIRFDDHFANQSEQFKALLDRSTEKLKLIEQTMPTGQRPNPVQLTGSGN